MLLQLSERKRHFLIENPWFFSQYNSIFGPEVLYFSSFANPYLPGNIPVFYCTSNNLATKPVFEANLITLAWEAN